MKLTGKKGKAKVGLNKVKRKLRTGRLLKLLLALFLFVSLVASVATYNVVAAYLADVPRFNPDVVVAPPESPFIFDRNGNEVTKLPGAENRIIVPLEQISPYLVQAFIAIEDERFFQHSGVDFEAILRAVFVTFREMDFGIQGGSTITQQLAKTAFLTHDKTVRRKVQELYLAFHLERTFTKNEILEFYLNMIFFDFNAYGVEAAARAYFGKSAADVTLAEAAMLAGIPNLPGRYSPRRNPEAAQSRQRLVLSRMYDLGKITQGEMAQAVEETERRIADGTWLTPPPQRTFPYFIDFVKSKVIEILRNIPGYEDSLYRGGLRIYTTLDQRVQRVAEETLSNDNLYRQRKVVAGQPVQPQAAVVVANPQTGHIRALVGGRQYEEDVQLAFNRAVAMTRPAGSVLKPIIAYAPSFEEGIAVPATVIDDAPAIWETGQAPWTPENYDDKFLGLVTARYAVAESLNLPAVRLFEQLGVEKGLAYAEQMGISTFVSPEQNRDKNDHGLGAVLGGLTDGLKVIDAAQAYAVLANRGVRTDLVAVLRIEDRNGKVLFEHTPRSEVVLSADSAYLMTSVLQDVVRTGTATRLRIGRPVAAKTGTSTGHLDAWLVAYTPDIVAAFWAGHDKNDDDVPAGGRIGPGFLNPIMIAAHEGLPVSEFTRPAGISPAIAVCRKSGKKPGPHCPPDHIVYDIFPHNRIPRDICDLHVAVEICRESGLLASEYCPAGSTVRRVFLNRPPYLTTDDRWVAGAGRFPADAGPLPPAAPCNVHTAAPPQGPPRDLSAAFQPDGTVLLAWQPAAGWPAGYLLYRQAPGQAVYLPLTADVITGLTFTDRTEAPGLYSYQVYAVSTAGVRSPAATVRVTVGYNGSGAPGSGSN
ncbi:MAG: Penicillin-binding protein 1F [Syntrophomonadaceae bacterium]|nr:Penicillin-binding protein 1F [Bacillota bacterium]